MASKRLSAKDRKRQICHCAKNIFLEKGFSKTTMEDIMRASGLSKGGLYHHYKSTSEILYDLIDMGNEKRFDITMQFLKENENLSFEDFLIEVILLKMVDYSEFKSLYVMFLIEARKNDHIQKLLHRIEEDSKNEFIQFIKKNNLEQLSCIVNEEFIAFITSMTIAMEFLDVRELFLKKDFLRNIIRNYIRENAKNIE